MLSLLKQVETRGIYAVIIIIITRLFIDTAGTESKGALTYNMSHVVTR